MVDQLVTNLDQLVAYLLDQLVEICLPVGGNMLDQLVTYLVDQLVGLCLTSWSPIWLTS